MENTILSQLKKDHEDIVVLLLKTEGWNDPFQRQESFQELKNLLLSHLQAEETSLYSKLKTEIDDVASEMADEALDEHDLIRDYIEILNGLDPLDEEWRQTFFDLKEFLLLHFEEEEAVLYEEVKEDFNREELTEFYTVYESVKEQSSLSANGLN